jgi:methionine biosynthesis protein MetW
MMQRGDLDTIVSWVPEGGKVLDLGCGDGELLHRLQAEKQVEGLGIDIDPANIIVAVGKGLRVVQQDMEEGLQNFEDSRFDAVIIAYSLQVLERPHAVLERIVSIGDQAIVTFPNFGHWRSRLSLMFNGRMPKTKALPYSWFDTPNIHFCTVADFESLCKDLKIEVLERRMSSNIGFLAQLWPNLFAKSASYRITRR